MTHELKQKVARAALAELKPGEVLGVGTGSTVNCFIDAMAAADCLPDQAVASSVATAERLAAHGVAVVDLNQVGTLSLYIDGADEVDAAGCLIKGGGGALTREKICAAAATRFIVLVDTHKCVRRLGQQFALPIEVIPMARSYVARQCIQLGGQPIYREGVVTDNGHDILDVHRLPIDVPQQWDARLNQIAGVVSHGLFANRHADVLYVSDAERVRRIVCDEK